MGMARTFWENLANVFVDFFFRGCRHLFWPLNIYFVAQVEFGEIPYGFVKVPLLLALGLPCSRLTG